MPNYNCPECGGNSFAVDPGAYLRAKGRNVKDLPVTCKGCGFTAKPSDFKKHKKKSDQKGFTILEVMGTLGALGVVAFCVFLLAHCRWFNFG